MRQAKTWHNLKQLMTFKKGNLFDFDFGIFSAEQQRFSDLGKTFLSLCRCLSNKNIWLNHRKLPHFFVGERRLNKRNFT